MTAGKISYHSDSTNTLSSVDVQMALANLRNSSAKLRTMVNVISNKGYDLDLNLKDGTTTPDPTPQDPSRPDLYAVTQKSSQADITVAISEQYLEEVNYYTDHSTGANAATSLERALVHEIVHAWQIAMGLPASGAAAE